ncbi:nucleoside permease [Luteibacter anthropi]|uniref:Nucleoside permease n=1 Tax=Luteibacter anthropi TaxID=564369 RepID=A0A7X5ZIN6_9GAMM|nr:nucleoside permease [Luteibacter anthropi]NII06860.1 nucleoside permease [Luteibacter anthropi]URX61470.1 nucleoside permease [Luteibacter anthropi]
MKWRLRLMMLFEYAIWGAWYVTVGTWLGQTLHFSGTEIGAIAGTTAIGAMISPLFVGLLADRLFDTRRVLTMLHIVGAVLLVIAAQQSSFGVLYAALLAYSLCYMPTLALTTSLAMRHIRDPQEEFGAIRVFGTLGWIAVGLVVGALGVEATASPLHLAAALSIVMAGYCFTLPATPPLANPQRFTMRHALPLESLHLLRNRSMAVFALASFLICIPLQFYYAFTNLFLNEVGVVNAAGKMTGGQMSEILCMLLIPWFFRRLGVKYMLAVGMLAWVIRYAMFAFGNPGELMWMLWLGIILHGICFDFFFVVGQIYIDREAPFALRAATQGLITFLTYGLGMFVGSWLSGVAVDTYSRTNAQGVTTHDWYAIWMIAGACAAVVLVLFVLLFKDRKATASEPVTSAT